MIALSLLALTATVTQPLAVELHDVPSLASLLERDPDVRLGRGGISGEVLERASAVQPGPLGRALGPIAWSTAPQIHGRVRLICDPARTQIVAFAGRDPLVVLTPHGVAIALNLTDLRNGALLR